MNILIFGDSIAAGMWDPQGGWAGRLSTHLSQITVESNLKLYYSVYNLSISGNSSEDIRTRFSQETAARLDPFNENVVLFAFGINDSQVELASNTNEVSIDTFRGNVIYLIKQCKELHVRVICIGLTPVDETIVFPMPWKPTHGYRQSSVDQYNDAIKQACAMSQTEFIDISSLPGLETLNRYLIDGVHPNSHGHQLMYDGIQSSLKSMGLS